MTDVLKRIRANCTECGDCLMWNGSVDTSGTPMVRVPGNRKMTPVRRLVLQAMGTAIKGKLATTSCDRKLCVAQDHAVAATRAELQQLTADRTLFQQRPGRNAKISASKRARGVVTPEQVAELRASPLSTRAAARLMGIAQSTAQQIRSGETHKDYSSPFAGMVGALA